MFNFRILQSGKQPSDAVYAEIIRSLYGNSAPIIYVSVALALVGWFTAAITGDLIVILLTTIGCAVAAIRVLIIWLYRREIAVTGLNTRVQAQTWERRYTIGTAITALIIGLLAARSMTLGQPGCTIMALGLAFGFGAGVVARGSLTPFVAIINLAAAGVPPVIAALLQSDPQYIGVGLFMAVYLVSSFQMVHVTYRSSVKLITLKQRFEQLSRIDPLTGLFNRSMQNNELIRIAPSGSGTSALYAIDLDRFKTANDRFGHLVGDALLRAVATRLKASVRESDVVMRMGGDEFVVVQNGLTDRSDAEQMARRIIETIRAPYRIEGHDIDIGVSIGIAIAPEDGKTTETLLARADAALYRAKERRNAFVFANVARTMTGNNRDIEETGEDTRVAA